VGYEIRTLRDADMAAAWNLASTAFGYRDRPMPDNWTSDTPGRRTLGGFDETGRLVAKAVDREQGQWFGGRLVPTSGVAGVAVAPEVRGRGLARLILTRLLTDARERGAVISTLFPTTPFPYRALGWEDVGALTYTAFPATAFAGVRPAPEITLRPAAEEDVPAIHSLYRAVAQASNGLMERTGPLFQTTPAELMEAFHGLTLAIGPSGQVEGYASWDRASGYNVDGKLTVYDLIGSTPAATAALLAMLGRWASVAPTVVMRLPDPDPARLFVSQMLGKLDYHNTWMLRVVDAAGAIAARGWPEPLHGTVDLELEDTQCPWNSGRYRLVLEGGRGELTPGGAGGPGFTARGLALWYAGGTDPAQLRRAGLLHGDTGGDALLRAATAGPAPALLDYF
jgi:predicted acetyltransferase